MGVWGMMREARRGGGQDYFANLAILSWTKRVTLLQSLQQKEGRLWVLPRGQQAA